MPIEKQVWKKKQEKFVRDGWQRYTTYVRKEYLRYLVQHAKKQNRPVLEVIDEAITKFIGSK